MTNFKRKKKKKREASGWATEGYYKRQGRSKGGKRKRETRQKRF